MRKILLRCRQFLAMILLITWPDCQGIRSALRASQVSGGEKTPSLFLLSPPIWSVLESRPWWWSTWCITTGGSREGALQVMNYLIENWFDILIASHQALYYTSLYTLIFLPLAGLVLLGCCFLRSLWCRDIREDPLWCSLVFLHFITINHDNY